MSGISPHPSDSDSLSRAIQDAETHNLKRSVFKSKAYIGSDDGRNWEVHRLGMWDRISRFFHLSHENTQPETLKERVSNLTPEDRKHLTTISWTAYRKTSIVKNLREMRHEYEKNAVADLQKQGLASGNIEQLLEDAKSNPHLLKVTDNEGNTILHLAAKNNAAGLDSLLKKGDKDTLLDALQKGNHQGETPLLLALKNRATLIDRTNLSSFNDIIQKNPSLLWRKGSLDHFDPPRTSPTDARSPLEHTLSDSRYTDLLKTWIQLLPLTGLQSDAEFQKTARTVMEHSDDPEILRKFVSISRFVAVPSKPEPILSNLVLHLTDMTEINNLIKNEGQEAQLRYINQILETRSREDIAKLLPLLRSDIARLFVIGLIDESRKSGNYGILASFLQNTNSRKVLFEDPIITPALISYAKKEKLEDVLEQHFIFICNTNEDLLNYYQELHGSNYQNAMLDDIESGLKNSGRSLEEFQASPVVRNLFKNNPEFQFIFQPRSSEYTQQRRQEAPRTEQASSSQSSEAPDIRRAAAQTLGYNHALIGKDLVAQIGLKADREDEAAIKQELRPLLLRYHPDKNPTAPPEIYLNLLELSTLLRDGLYSAYLDSFEGR